MGWLGEKLGFNDPMRKGIYADIDPRLGQQSQEAAGFARTAESGYGDMTGQLQGDRQYLQGLRSGKNSLAKEQLRQGLAQQYGQMQSAAASARPGQAPMAARTAMMGMQRAGTGMAGNAAMAGIAERNAAAQTLAGLNVQQRGQDVQAALGSQGNAIQGLSALEQARADRYAASLGVPTKREALAGAIGGGLGAFGIGGK